MLVRDKALHQQDRSIVHTEQPLGTDQAITREGFLLCRNVPIARVGMQEYLNDEICAEEDTDNELFAARGKNGIVQVLREEEDVFHPDTLASFEGKDVVDDHPDDPVTPDNYHEHTVGVTLNPRRGEGAMADFIIADLLIKKASAIAAVRAGKREVSCGYDADYEVLGPGRARQRNIIGNHVALVDRGRCGFRCAIGDKDMTKTKDKNEQVRDAAARGLLRRMLDAIKGKDRKALDKLMDEMEEAEGDEASEKETMEATGTHIHLHLGGEQEAKGGDPSKAGAADEEEEPGEGEESPAAGADQNTEKRLLALESGQNQILEALRKIAARVGLSEEEESEDEEAGEEEAEGEVPESSDDAEGEEEEEKPKKEPKDKKGADKMGVSKMGLKSSDKKATKDSAGLKDEFTEVKSDAEVLAPGLKAPTFDAKAPAKTTQDSMCLLRRRALAAAMRDEKNGGKEAVQTVLGKKSLTGLDCASVEPVFNGAVALMRDRNMQDDKPTTISEARGGKKTADQAPVTSVADLNAQNRAHYKQSPAKQ